LDKSPPFTACAVQQILNVWLIPPRYVPQFSTWEPHCSQIDSCDTVFLYHIAGQNTRLAGWLRMQKEATAHSRLGRGRHSSPSLPYLTVTDP
jgi:hypothetical protein